MAETSSAGFLRGNQLTTMLKYYIQNGSLFSLKSVTIPKVLRITILFISGMLALYFAIQGGTVKSIFTYGMASIFCSCFAIIYLLKLSKKLIIDKDVEQLNIKENLFSKTQIFDLKNFAQIHLSQSTTNFIPVAATASLIFYNGEIQSVAILEQKYFSTISSLEGIITETKMIINLKK